MIRTVIKVLKKHLDEAYEERNQWEAIEVSPWDVLQEYPDYHQLRRLAHELVGTIRGVDVAKLIKIRSYQDTLEFLQYISPMGTNSELIADQTRRLRSWLGDTGQISNRTLVQDIKRGLETGSKELRRLDQDDTNVEADTGM